MKGYRLVIKGQVQGVGFRPKVWQIANKMNLNGTVYNDANGVIVELVGQSQDCNDFIRALRKELPPLAKIDSIHTYEQDLCDNIQGFDIGQSHSGSCNTQIAPDVAICHACKKDTLGESQGPNRRKDYPFTNCTHCGPRLSLIRAMPYDRHNTSMSSFPMCADCELEYQAPDSRWFHAQPIACPQCGPKLWLEFSEPSLDHQTDKVIEQAITLLKQGKILAVKGIGGFHLVADATNHGAISRLRFRKNRPHKPFAVMMRDVKMVSKYCHVKTPYVDWLQGSEAPVVLLKQKAQQLPENLNPELTELGVILPYSPLHLLLSEGIRRPLVMTSGNLSGNPQCIDNEQARQDLKGIADVWLMHNRDIVNRLDDSVIRPVMDTPLLLRRARGYAPKAIDLPAGFEQVPNILALGGQLKNTFALVKADKIVLSQYIGELEQARAYQDYLKNIQLYLGLFAFSPEALTVDKHPGYVSTQHGQHWAADNRLPLSSVQHHHSHIVSCMLDNQLPIDSEPVLGICFDGSGYGDDGNIWGGEWLKVSYTECQRLAHLANIPLIGGARAITEPWRLLYAHIKHHLGWDLCESRFGKLDIINKLQQKPLSTMDNMQRLSVNCPNSSSAGRLFDAVAALLDIRFEGISYEGQAAIELEALAEQSGDEGFYPVTVAVDEKGPVVLNLKGFWLALISDLATGKARADIARKFHTSLAKMTATLSIGLLQQFDNRPKVLLSGGVMQNALLVGKLVEELQKVGFEVLLHRQLPTNDGGLAAGQAAVSAAKAIASNSASYRESIPAIK